MGWVKSLFGIGKPKLEASTANDALADHWYEEYPQSNAVGIAVTADGALRKNSGVFSCTSILADIISPLPFGIYKLRQPGVIDGGMDPAPNHPVHDIISLAPNGWQTPCEFWGMMVLNAAIRGVAYAEIKPGPRGFVDRLIAIPPDNVTKEEMLPDGTLRFEITDQKTAARRYLLQSEVLRIPWLTSDGIRGLKIIDYASEAIGIGIGADQYAARVFSNALNMGGFFSLPGKLSKEGITRLIRRLMARYSGASKFHVPMVLTEGAKYEKASMNANEAQLLEARKWQISEIARYWRIPLHLLGIDDQTNKATVEEQWLNFVRCTIRPWAEKIEQAVRRDLILPEARRYYVAVFNLDDLERGNADTRKNYFSAALGSGGSPPWMTQNEVRTAEGLNKVDDPQADKLAAGTNPSQSTPSRQPPQQQQGAEQTPTPPAVERVEIVAEPEVPDDDLVLAGGALVRKEAAALRKLAMRYSDDPAAFRKAVNVFYGGFASEVARRLGVTKEQARAWCKSRSERIGGANDVAAAIDAIEAEIEAPLDL